MTGPFHRFPDVQAVLMDLLEQFVGGAGHTGSETPDDLLDRLPFIRVVRRGGPSDRVSDYARVEVDMFGLTYAETEDLAQRVHQYMTNELKRSGPAVIDRVGVQTVPVELEWSPGVRRFGGTYTVVSRRYLATT